MENSEKPRRLWGDSSSGNTEFSYTHKKTGVSTQKATTLYLHTLKTSYVCHFSLLTGPNTSNYSLNRISTCSAVEIESWRWTNKTRELERDGELNSIESLIFAFESIKLNSPSRFEVWCTAAPLPVLNYFHRVLIWTLQLVLWNNFTSTKRNMPLLSIN